jgi:hypothetical protein
MTNTIAASTPARPAQPTVDQTALRVNQACIIALLLIAFLFDQPWLVAAVGLIMLVGTLWPQAGLFKLFYSRLLRPAGLLKPAPEPDEPQPHLFAQGLGALVLAAATLALWGGATVAGWLLAWVVVVLAGVNLFLGFCLGCFVYYQLARRGLRVDLPAWRQPSRVRNHG